jgi:hypothetical protein
VPSYLEVGWENPLSQGIQDQLGNIVTPCSKTGKRGCRCGSKVKRKKNNIGEG